MLDGVGLGPAWLRVWGEAGIGKTTVLQAGISDARERGYRVLASSPAEAELRLSYSGLTDLLDNVDEATFEGLSAPRRRALEAALLRRADVDQESDPRAVATGLLSVMIRLSGATPLLLAIDDLQWLDEPSRRVVAFAFRRCRGPVVLLTTERPEFLADARNELCPSDPDRILRMQVGPLTVGALHHVIRQATGRSFARPTMLSIADRSSGNPFFAIEIARSLGVLATGVPALPSTLAQAVNKRIGLLAPAVREVMLVASAAAQPRVELIGQACGAADILEVLASAEDSGLVELSGGELRFRHPLWAEGVYNDASGPERRAVHARLSSLVEDVEERARHLALSATAGPAETVSALDAAADRARARGAASAAAELLEMAIGLGARDAARRVRAACDHFDADDPGRATELLEDVVADLGPGPQRAEALVLLGALSYQGNDYVEAIEILEQAYAEAGEAPSLRGRIAMELAVALNNSGQLQRGAEYATIAVGAAGAVGDDGLLAEALSGHEVYQFMLGHEIDEDSLALALDLEDRDRRSHAVLWPSLNAAMIQIWTHQLMRARSSFAELHDRCVERGSESDLWFVLAHSSQLALWCGDVEAAERLQDELTDRADMTGSDIPQALALGVRGLIAAWRGRVPEARTAGSSALTLLRQSRFAVAALYSLGALGMVELSVGNAAAAADYLAPAAAQMTAYEFAEPALIPFWPDAAEALITVGRFEEAEVIIERLEVSGGNPSRIWARAMAARCRGLLLAARGDVEGAAAAYGKALTVHEQLPDSRYDLARTLLVAGQLQRRRRERRAARASLARAAQLFEEVGTNQWATQARAELDRTGSSFGGPDQLTPTEARVAELAASGHTNREVAALLFISAKTVEANLARVYRKLGIHSRAELGRTMAQASSKGNPPRHEE